VDVGNDQAERRVRFGRGERGRGVRSVINKTRGQVVRDAPKLGDRGGAVSGKLTQTTK